MVHVYHCVRESGFLWGGKVAGVVGCEKRLGEAWNDSAEMRNTHVIEMSETDRCHLLNNHNIGRLRTSYTYKDTHDE